MLFLSSSLQLTTEFFCCSKDNLCVRSGTHCTELENYWSVEGDGGQKDQNKNLIKQIALMYQSYSLVTDQQPCLRRRDDMDKKTNLYDLETR